MLLLSIENLLAPSLERNKGNLTGEGTWFKHQRANRFYHTGQALVKSVTSAIQAINTIFRSIDPVIKKISTERATLLSQLSERDQATVTSLFPVLEAKRQPEVQNSLPDSSSQTLAPDAKERIPSRPLVLQALRRLFFGKMLLYPNKLKVVLEKEIQYNQVVQKQVQPGLALNPRNHIEKS